MSVEKLVITPEQMEEYRRGAREREARQRAADDQRQQEARLAAQAAAQLLKEQYGATRVILFGSLAHGAWFHARSDIDLAVAGIPAGSFWRAWCALDTLRVPFEINLVAIEEAPERLLASIRQEGINL
jgi:predicted nucleotidyltransferase